MIVKGPTAGVRVPADVVVIDDAASRKGQVRDPRGGRRPSVPGVGSLVLPEPARRRRRAGRARRPGHREPASTRRPSTWSTSTPGSGCSRPRVAGNRGAPVTAVERAKSSVGDARHNLKPGTKVLPIDVEKWRRDPGRRRRRRSGSRRVWAPRSWPRSPRRAPGSSRWSAATPERWAATRPRWSAAGYTLTSVHTRRHVPRHPPRRGGERLRPASGSGSARARPSGRSGRSRRGRSTRGGRIRPNRRRRCPGT